MGAFDRFWKKDNLLKKTIVIDNSLYERLNEMAKNAFYAQYIGYTTEDLHTFLNRQVFFGQDPKKSERTKVVETYLIPPNNISAAENIIKEILGK